MPTSAAIYSPPAAHDVVTLAGTILTNAQFATQPVAGDQVVFPTTLTVSATLSISGATGSYVLWHILADGTAVRTPYTIGVVGAPTLSGAAIDQVASTSLRFSVQTNKAGGTWYVKIGTSMPSDGDTVSTGEDAAVASASVLTHTFSSLTPNTLYYIKAVHIDADTNVSNYVSAVQRTLTSGSVTLSVVYRPPAGHTVATIAPGFDDYATADLLGTVAASSQLVTPSLVDYYDSNGDYFGETEGVIDVIHITASGTAYHDTIDTTGLGTVVPLDLDDQSVTGCEPNTYQAMQDTVIIPGGSGHTSVVDNIQAQQRFSTNGGSTWSDWASDQINDLEEDDQIQYRMLTGADYQNTGSDYHRTAIVTVATIQFSIATTNRNAFVPVITVQPTTQSVDLADPVTLSVTANTGGLADPMTYQWRRGGVNIGGATSSSYNIGSAALSDAGSYTVRIVSSEGGVTISNAAVLTVASDPPVYVESAEGLADINAPGTLLLGQDVDYEILAAGVVILSGTATTHSTTGKLRVDSVTSIMGAESETVELRYPVDSTNYYHGENVTVQAV